MDLDKIIAIISMETGLPGLPLSGGGLGWLMGDILRSMADKGRRAYNYSLLYSMGNFRQEIVDGRQRVFYENYNPKKDMELLDTLISVPIEDRNVDVRAWMYKIKGNAWSSIPLFFLDTTSDKNRPWDKDITKSLYMEAPNDNRYWRIAQEEILGIGSVRMMHELNKRYGDKFPLPEVYHLNEGHGAFAAIELIKIYGEKEARDKIVFFSHTPIEAGHDRFNFEKIRMMLGKYLEGIDIRRLAGYDDFNMTRLAVNMSRSVSGVSEMHAEVCRDMEVFKGVDVGSVTNGVHPFTWIAPEFQSLFDKYIPGWRGNPSKLAGVEIIPDSELLSAHFTLKKRLVEFVNQKNKIGKIKFDPNILTIGFARRFVDYKRADLILEDIRKLHEAYEGPIQILFAGKAHPLDWRGNQILENIVKFVCESDNNVRGAFIEDYDYDTAFRMVSGSDFWLNTPRRPYEASGTSGMKAALNGVPSFSTIDGWVYEAPIINGKRRGMISIGVEPDRITRYQFDDFNDAQDLRRQMKDEVKKVYESPSAYVKLMKEAIINGSFFNTHRVVDDLFEKIY